MRFNLKTGRLPWGLEHLRRVIPPRCWACQQWLGSDQKTREAYPFVCRDCLAALPWTDPTFSCLHCGHQTADMHQISCPQCIDKQFHFDQLWSGFHYESQVQQWIVQYKYGKKEQMASLLGRLLSLSLQQYDLPQVDGIIPIPLHRKRLQERGFNQALLLAHRTFDEHRLLQPYWLQRIRSTTPQTELPHSQRMLNVKNAFHAEPQVAGKQVLLLDDVMTTGATLDAAAQTLKQAGALSVSVVVFARRMVTPKIEN